MAEMAIFGHFSLAKYDIYSTVRRNGLKLFIFRRN